MTDAAKIKDAEWALLSAHSVSLGRRISNYENRFGHKFDIVHYDQYRIELRCRGCHYGIGFRRLDLVIREDVRFGEFHCNDTAIEELLDSVGEIKGLDRRAKIEAFSSSVIEPE